MRNFLLVLEISLFTLAGHSQGIANNNVISNRALRIFPGYIEVNPPQIEPFKSSDSIIQYFEKYYENSSSINRSKFENFVRRIEMVNPRQEIQTVIDVFGTDFYRRPISKLIQELQDNISSSFPQLPNGQYYWDKKFQAYDSVKKPLKESPFHVDKMWENPNDQILLGVNPVVISPNAKTSVGKILLKNEDWITNQTKNDDYAFNGDSLFSIIDSSETAFNKYNFRITIAHNLLVQNKLSKAESILRSLGSSIFYDETIKPKDKLNLILATNKLLCRFFPINYYKTILINYSRIRVILKNPALYVDKRLNQKIRTNRLIQLDNFEIQSLLRFTEHTSGNSSFLEIAWSTLNKRKNNQPNNSILDYVLISQMKSEKLFMKRLEVWYRKLYNPDYEQHLILSEHWSLFQSLHLLNKPNTNTYPFIYGISLKTVILHCMSTENRYLVENVMLNAISNLKADSESIEHFSHILYESFILNNRKDRDWWWKKLKPKKVRQLLTFRRPQVITDIDVIPFQGGEDQMAYFLTPKFLEDLEPILEWNSLFALRNNIHASNLSVIAQYCEEHGAYKNAHFALKLYKEIYSCDDIFDNFSQALIENQSFEESISTENKSLENSQLKDYQNQLTNLNNELSKSNSGLTRSLIVVAVLGVIILGLFIITQRTKNRLKQKSQELENQKRTLEAISLSIGQIGHLAKNAVSQIRNTYFLSPTQHEIDMGKKALKRLRNVFQKFEENGSKTKQTIEEEILFAADLILIQNREFGEQKTKQDIFDRILCENSNLVYAKINVPLYTVVNILDNSFKHSDLSNDIQVRINGVKDVNVPNGYKNGRLLMIECSSKTLENENPIGDGSGTEYVTEMLKNYSNWEYAHYVKGQTTTNGYRHSILLLEKDTY
jgi:hypothetical protein